MVVSMFVTTYLLVKSWTDVNKKNEATPIDATTMKIHMYFQLPLGTPLGRWWGSVRCCQPCKLVDRQKSVKASAAFSPFDCFTMISFGSFSITARLFSLLLPFIIIFGFGFSSRHFLQRWFEFWQIIKTLTWPRSSQFTCSMWSGQKFVYIYRNIFGPTLSHLTFNWHSFSSIVSYLFRHMSLTIMSDIELKRLLNFLLNNQ